MGEAVQGAAALITLPQRLDTGAAASLKDDLLAGMAGAGGAAALRLDASGVDYVGGLCLQLLLASGLKVGPCSEKAEEAFTLFGVRELLMGAGEKETGGEASHGG